MSFKEECVRRIQGERSNLRINRANVHKSQLTAIVQNLRDLCAHNVLNGEMIELPNYAHFLGQPVFLSKS